MQSCIKKKNRKWREAGLRGLGYEDCELHGHLEELMTRLNQEGNAVVLISHLLAAVSWSTYFVFSCYCLAAETLKCEGESAYESWDTLPPFPHVSGITHSAAFSPILYVVGVLCCAQSLSHVQLFVTPWTVAQQAPLAMGIFQARMLLWVAVPSSSRSSQPWDWTEVPCTADRLFTITDTRDAHILWVCK